MRYDTDRVPCPPARNCPSSDPLPSSPPYLFNHSLRAGPGPAERLLAFALLQHPSEAHHTLEVLPRRTYPCSAASLVASLVSASAVISIRTATQETIVSRLRFASCMLPVDLCGRSTPCSNVPQQQPVNRVGALVLLRPIPITSVADLV
ncbi:hypothetical protein DL98DRAFT_188036 [Cadophora sp. DSE1049]|nr:hypothetical protein DL98DRAFT_188036 [Cadophora sp. DSE1049]